MTTDNRNSQSDIVALHQHIADLEHRNAQLMQQVNELSMLHTLIETIPEALLIATIDGKISYTNLAFQSLFQYGKEINGESPSIIYAEHELHRFPVLFQELQEHGWIQGSITCRRKDGSHLPGHFTVFRVQDAAGQSPQLVALLRDLTDQQRLEQERMALKEQVIAAQQSALLELSTPLIPIADQVVVMPIIGVIDTTRAQRMLETLLDGVATLQTSIAILDITGVRIVDTQIANTFVRAAQAVQLLGTRIIITGIRPEVAQTMVQLGVDLQGIITYSTLQAGIAHALTYAST
ncbi:MAG: STAS domain-containing protein [Chloroflexota bacterium]